MTLFCRLVLLFFTLFSSFAAKTESNRINLNKFLKNYFEVNETKKNIDLDRDIQISNSEAVANTSSGTFSITPQRQARKDNNIATSWNKQDEVTGSYSQNLPTGTSIRLGGTKYLRNETIHFLSTNIGVDHSYFLRLEQDLWKNSFGLVSRNNNKIARANIKASKINHAINLAKKCNEAISIYLDAYKNQINFEIFKKLNESSQNSFATIKKAYKQRVTRKIDYIAAQADQLNNKRRLVVAEASYKTSLTHLLNSIGKSAKDLLILEMPRELKADNVGLKLSDDYKEAYQLKLNVQKLSYQAKKSISAPEVKLFLQGQQNNNQFSALGTTNDLQIYNVGLNINIPINDKQLNSDVKSSYYQYKKSENEFNYQIRKLSNDLLNQIQLVNNLSEQLSLLKKQISIYQQQTLEAHRLLRTGRIEYIEYTRYRDLELNNEINQIEILKNILTSQNTISLLTNPKSNFCRGLSK